MTLKKIEVFEDPEGNLFRSEAEYKTALDKIKAKQEEEMKAAFLLEMVQTVFPRYKKGSVVSEDSFAAEKLALFMTRVSLEDLKTVGEILLKYKTQKFDDIMGTRIR